MGRRRSSKRPPRPTEKHRVGRRIRAREVRVIDHDGGQRGVMDTRDALDLANEHSLQLVEVNPKANPPVCKVMDYGKFKYETAKREREAKKHQVISELKEIKFRPKTHGHDFDFKVRHCRRFLGDGDKVKLVVQFRGREVTHPETGRHVLDRVVETCADIAQVIQMPSMEGNRMNMVLAPRKDAQQQAPKRPKTPTPAPGEDLAASPAASPAAATPASQTTQGGGAPSPAAADGGDKPAPAAPAAPAASGEEKPSTAESSA
ncbi:MAG: translation initiation factor IF-3 [Nannocystaceae bacterium]|nr:translation initiation factor IF-3 [Nannocystaceae bacterium]